MKYANPYPEEQNHDPTISAQQKWGWSLIYKFWFTQVYPGDPIVRLYTPSIEDGGNCTETYQPVLP